MAKALPYDDDPAVAEILTVAPVPSAARRPFLETLVERAAGVPAGPALFPPLAEFDLEVEPELVPELELAAPVSAAPAQELDAAPEVEAQAPAPTEPAEVIEPLLQRIGAYTAKPARIIVH